MAILKVLKPFKVMWKSSYNDYSQLMSCGQHTARIRLDRICWTDSPHPVQFHSSKDHIVQDRPRSSCDCEGLVFAKCIWSGNKPACKNPWAWFLPNASDLETSQRARILGPGSCRTQLTRYQFPTFRHGCLWILHVAQTLLDKTSLDPSVFCSS